MCGIVGYVGSREAKPLLLEGLRRLEYRGYDSAGIALREDDSLEYVRAVGNLSNLVAAAGPNGSHSCHGLGHTRWATHGGVTERNAHPLTGCEPHRMAIVLNGIIENYMELREQLAERGHTLTSETDAEVVVHLLEEAYEGDLAQALVARLPAARGPLLDRRHPPRPARRARRRPAPDAARRRARRGRELPRLLDRRLPQRDPHRHPPARRRGGRDHAARASASSSTAQRSRRRSAQEIDWDEESAEKAGYETFMLKEIFEQPEAVSETIGDRVRGHKLMLEALGMTELEVRNLRRIVIVACGTAYHAGVVGRYILEEWARVPVEPDIASEWIYRNPVLSKDTLVIGISQSGETRDTVNAVKLARASGARTLAITNLMGTQITREAEATLYTRCGMEVGVAASKTFTAQVALLSLLALRLAEIRRTLPEDEIEFILDRLHELPQKMQEFLDGDHPIESIAQRFHDAPFFLYLGRHIGLPVALEGALKLKEISYIPTDAYSAGEMKHGPIALLAEGTPVVVVATNIHVYDKIVSNIQETRARGAHVIAIATDGNEDIQHHADDVIYVPRTPNFLQASLAVIPLQLLAYRIARLRGLNVDQPRNLAKTVTVE